MDIILSQSLFLFRLCYPRRHSMCIHSEVGDGGREWGGEREWKACGNRRTCRRRRRRFSHRVALNAQAKTSLVEGMKLFFFFFLFTSSSYSSSSGQVWNNNRHCNAAQRDSRTRAEHQAGLPFNSGKYNFIFVWNSIGRFVIFIGTMCRHFLDWLIVFWSDKIFWIVFYWLDLNYASS